LDNTLTNLSGKDVAGLLTYLGFGDRLLEANGYFELPGGFLLQWGRGSVQATNATVRFEKPFNVTPFIVLPHKITADNRYVTSVNYTLTGFSLYGWNGGGVATNIDSYTYFALGM
ncbi:gp53-like domain-containing protein, partial [Escherichia coli]|uniref:gp53-like domain-containing protein n=3 Tax=Enterobacteriaceae TaxID=543 RepID=UPI003B9D520A